ncbi:MAG TPA: sugar phosphate nucleotidyltransferase [Acidimicrobiales bacterium]|nr:sugar phosphate nucleotidyltransferase [Acidimicrobiales bacterium]
MQCVVLAGGRGTRMRPFTDTRPKCLIPVAGHPFIDWQLAWLAAEGVERVVLSVGYGAELVRAHVGDGGCFDLAVDYVDDGDVPLGTGGALRRALDEGKLDGTFFLVYGDSYLPVRFGEVGTEYRQRSTPVLMTVYRDPGHLETPNAVLDHGMVIRYEKGLAPPPPEMQWVDYGLAVWSRDAVIQRIPTSTVMDLAAVYGALSREDRLAGMEVTARFYEIGSLEGWRDMESLIGRGGALAPLPHADRSSTP